MKAEHKEKLSNKLVALVNYAAELRENKRAANSSFNEQLKGVQKRIDKVGEAMEKEDITLLQGVFDDVELEHMFERKFSKDRMPSWDPE